MSKRYVTLGFAIVLALSLAVPALGGPSNPVAQTAVTAAKAFKKAKAAKQAADAAQSTASSAQSSASTAQSTANAAQTAASAAQTTANNALAESGDVSLADLEGAIDTTTSANDSTTPKTVVSTCPAGKTPISLSGNIGLGIGLIEEVDVDGTAWYLSEYAVAHEEDATASNWAVTVQAMCVQASG